MSKLEYGVYFVNNEADELHHIHKTRRPGDAVREARYILEDMRNQEGHYWRLHGRWSDEVEVWEIHPGDHGFSKDAEGRDGWRPTAPDRLLAHARWADEDLTAVDGFSLAEEE